MRTLRPWNINSNSTEKKSIEKDGKVTITIPKTCTADQDKPECSLIQELQEVQRKLQLKNQYEKEKEDIMRQLTGKAYGATVGSFLYYNIKVEDTGSYPLTRLVYNGARYSNIDELNGIIDLLQQYKEAVIKYEEYKVQYKILQQREKEIKLQLGIR